VLGAIPLARAVRDQGAGQRSLERTWERIHLLDGVIEMGSSLQPLVHTLGYMESEPWRWGKTYARSLATVWPNLARRWEGRPYMALEDLPPNHWVTAQAAPDMYRNEGGLGFSAVAEPYMNFGVAGVLLYFCGLGAALGRAVEFGSPRPLHRAALAAVLGPLLWTTRNSFEIFFRPAVWGLGILLVCRIAAGLAGASGRRRLSFDPGLHDRLRRAGGYQRSHGVAAGAPGRVAPGHMQPRAFRQPYHARTSG
jgi:hypothetical protein